MGLDLHPIPYEQLIAYTANELDGAQSDAVELHLATCQKCLKTVTHLWTLRTALKADDLLSPPRVTLARTYAIFKPAAVPARQRQPTTTSRARVVSFALPWAVWALVLMLVFGANKLAAQSLDALPGDPLYAVKTAVERVQVGLTMDEDARTQLQLDLASRRVVEITVLAERGRYEAIPSVARAFEGHIQKATTTVDTATRQGMRDKTVLAHQVDAAITQYTDVLENLERNTPPLLQPALDRAVNASRAEQNIVQKQILDAPTSGPASLAAPQASPTQAVPTPTPQPPISVASTTLPPTVTQAAPTFVVPTPLLIDPRPAAPTATSALQVQSTSTVHPATPTPISATATSIPSTATPLSTATAVLPTSTPVPTTAVPSPTVPSTPTTQPSPTAPPSLPTTTLIPSSATSVPFSASSPTPTAAPIVATPLPTAALPSQTAPASQVVQPAQIALPLDGKVEPPTVQSQTASPSQMALPSQLAMPSQVAPQFPAALPSQAAAQIANPMASTVARPSPVPTPPPPAAPLSAQNAPALTAESIQAIIPLAVPLTTPPAPANPAPAVSIVAAPDPGATLLALTASPTATAPAVVSSRASDSNMTIQPNYSISSTPAPTPLPTPYLQIPPSSMVLPSPTLTTK